MRVSSGDFIRKFGTYTDSALSEPIIITKNGRERLVLLSIDEYNTLLHLRDLYEDSKEATNAKRAVDPGVLARSNARNRQTLGIVNAPDTRRA
jgi:prevent-host-death family protein